MPASPESYASTRQRMIEGQIRPDRVRHPRIIAAMGSLPREIFVPPHLADIAYIDKEIGLDGRALMEPRVLARLLQAVEPLPGERALVVSAGAGYTAAVLAALGAGVVAVEADDRFREQGERACRAAGQQVTWTATIPSGRIFDLVVIDGGVEFVPAEIAALVAPHVGRLATILREPAQPGRAVVGERTEGALRLRAVFDAQSSLLPGFGRAPGFVF